MKIICYLMCAYLLLRPYYFFQSGLIQISDIFLILAFFCLLLLNKKDKRIIKEKISANKHFLWFIILGAIINIIGCIICPDKRFVLSTLYYVFGFCAVILFSYCFEKEEGFIKSMNSIFKINLIIQLLLTVTHLTRLFGGVRNMGTFNDPNQFGYYVLISFAYILLVTLRLKKKFTMDLLFYFIISVFLIITSRSTGMFLGLIVFTVLVLLYTIKNSIRSAKKTIALVAATTIVAVLMIPVINPNSNIITAVTESEMFSRVMQKIDRANTNTTQSVNIWEDRALDFIILYPEGTILGTGEGGSERFDKVFRGTEIHSTFPAILFYYGIIPTGILLYWIYEKLKGIRGVALITYLALLAESFTLANQRQALFWVIIALAPFIVKEIKNEKGDSRLLDR